MADQTTARDRAIEMAARLEWAVAEEPGYGFLLRSAREAAEVLRTISAIPEGVDAADELHSRNVEAKSATIRAAGLAAELADAQAAIQRVRALHRRGDSSPWCEHCDVRGDGDPVLWPCPTLRAIDGDTTETERT